MPSKYAAHYDTWEHLYRSGEMNQVEIAAAFGASQPTVRALLVKRGAITGDMRSRRYPSAKERLWDGVDRSDPEGCWDKGKVGTYTQLLVDGEPVLAHRFSYELEVGPIPDGMIVRHRCDNPSCVNPSHLELGTHADNMADMVDRGRASTKGKLDEAAVRDIRDRLGKETHEEIARDYGVATSTVSHVAAGYTWKQV
jgi:hypothetical protein